MGAVITPEDASDRKKLKKAAKELGMEVEELETLLRKGKPIKRLE